MNRDDPANIYQEYDMQIPENGEPAITDSPTASAAHYIAYRPQRPLV